MNKHPTYPRNRNRYSPRMCRMFPVSLELPISKATKPIFKKRGFSQHQILTHWQDIAGPYISRHSLPVKLHFPPGKQNDGCLTIKAWNGISLELQHYEPQILEKLATYFGYRAINRIRILQSPIPQPVAPGVISDKIE